MEGLREGWFANVGLKINKRKESKTMKENENKKQVTNEELLEHLHEIERSQSAIANGINTIFYLLDERAEELKLNKEEIRMIQAGMITMALVSGHMADISGMNETETRKKEKQAEVHIVSKEDMEGFVDFLKEIFE